MSSRYLKSGKWEVEVDKLLLKVEALEKRIQKLEGGDPPNPWSRLLTPFGNPSLPMNGRGGSVEWFKKNTGGIVINCSLNYMESLPNEILDGIYRREKPEEAYSTCVAVRFQLQKKEKGAYQADLLQRINEWWTVSLPKDDGIHTLKSNYQPQRYSNFSDESDLQKAMDVLFAESPLYQRNVVTMVCRMSIKPGSYIRLHLSKGWSHYFQLWVADKNTPVYVYESSNPERRRKELEGRGYPEGTVLMSTDFSFDVAAINPTPGVEGMSMKMRVQFSSGKDGLRVKLPSWFKPLSRDGGFDERRSFYGKVTRVFDNHDDPERPRSWSIKNGITAQWNRRKGTKGRLRNELRCVGREFSDIDLPAEGMFDLELKL